MQLHPLSHDPSLSRGVERGTMDQPGQADAIVPPPTSHHPPPILLDSVFLLLLRLVYFLLARRFLLVHLNPTLRDLSKLETLLPPTASSAAEDGRPRSASGTTIIPASEYELELELDLETDDDRLLSSITPSSSHPGSPSKSPGVFAAMSPLPRDPYARRNTDEGLAHVGTMSSSSLPTVPEVGGSMELENLGRKLNSVGNAGGRSIQVLSLSHGRRGEGGSKKIKKATRGLSQLARILFLLCFAESCNLLTLVIFHAVGFLHSRARHVNFSLSLHVLLALVLLIIPLVQCLLFTYRSKNSVSPTTAPSRSSSLALSSRTAVALIPFALYCFLFSLIPPYMTAVPLDSTLSAPEPSNATDSAATLDEAIANWSTSGPEGWEGGGWLASSLGRVVVLGVVVLGSLSGFGAVRTAWNFFEHVIGGGSRIITDHDLLQGERSLYQVRHELMSKREESSRLASSSLDSPQARGWMGRVFGSKSDQEAASVQAELDGLQSMEWQAAKSLFVMKRRKRKQQFRRTLRGKIYNFIGYVFAIYCAARLLMCVPSLFLAPLASSQTSSDAETAEHNRGKGNTNGDWISVILALGLSRLPTGTIDIDVAVWSRAISLLLTGLLILSSLNQILRNLSRILRLASKTAGAGFLLLSLGQLFSTYIISLLVQLRTALPPAPAIDSDPFSPFSRNSTTTEGALPFSQEADDSLLSSLPDFRVFGRLFDIVFLFAALGTAAFRYIAMKVTGANDGGVLNTLG